MCIHVGEGVRVWIHVGVGVRVWIHVGVCVRVWIHVGVRVRELWRVLTRIHVSSDYMTTAGNFLFINELFIIFHLKRMVLTSFKIN